LAVILSLELQLKLRISVQFSSGENTEKIASFAVQWKEIEFKLS